MYVEFADEQGSSGRLRSSQCLAAAAFPSLLFSAAKYSSKINVKVRNMFGETPPQDEDG
jgi:hypothetical protein